MRGFMIIIQPEDGRLPLPQECTEPPSLLTLQTAVLGDIEHVATFNVLKVGERFVPCIVFVNEDGKRNQMPVNAVATLLWSEAVKLTGGNLQSDTGVFKDLLVGPAVILYGDREFLTS